MPARGVQRELIQGFSPNRHTAAVSTLDVKTVLAWSPATDCTYTIDGGTGGAIKGGSIRVVPSGVQSIGFSPATIIEVCDT